MIFGKQKYTHSTTNLYMSHIIQISYLQPSIKGFLENKFMTINQIEGFIKSLFCRGILIIRKSFNEKIEAYVYFWKIFLKKK